MNALSTTRNWTIGGVLVTVVVLLLGFFLGVQPQLQAAAIAQRDLAEVEATNQVQRAELEALKLQFKDLPEITAELDKLRLSIPATSSLDEFTTQLAGQIAATGVTLVTFTATTGAAFVPSAQFAGIVPPGVDQTNFATIAFQLSAVGSRDGIVAFIAGLQDGGRLVLVDQFTMLNSGDAGGVAVDLSGLLYVLLDEPVVADLPAGETTPPVEPVAPPAP